MSHVIVWCMWCDTKFKHQCHSAVKCSHFPCRCWGKRNNQYTLGQHKNTTQHLFVSRWTVQEEFLIDIKYHLHFADTCTRQKQRFVPRPCIPHVEVGEFKVHNYIPGPCQCVPNILEVDNTCDCIKIDLRFFWAQRLKEIRNNYTINRV